MSDNEQEPIVIITSTRTYETPEAEIRANAEADIAANERKKAAIRKAADKQIAAMLAQPAGTDGADYFDKFIKRMAH